MTPRYGDRLRRARETALVYAIRLIVLVVIVVVAYALVVLGIGDVPTSRQSTLLAFSALAAVVVALTYASLSGPVTAWARTLVSRDGVSDDVVRMFSRRAASGLPLDELLAALVESLGSGLALTAGEVWTYSSGVLQLAASEPSRSRPPMILRPAEEAVLVRAGVVGRPWLALWLPALLEERDVANLRVAAMVHAGELIGVMVAKRDAGQSDFTKEDDDVLGLLSRQAALALRNVRLGSALDASMEELRLQADELRESRARVVAAADAERQRIERNLHDGAQQHLLGLAVNLKVVREVGSSDPAHAETILAALSSEVHAALDQLRDLAHGIYPPLLAERGIVDAVRGSMARLRVAGGVQADQLGRYPAEVEATVYFCCVEAIQNAAKHAPEARVSVRLWATDDALLFEVGDDGPGFDPALTSESFGVTNMRDRVGALGGNLRVEARPRFGTRITGAVPVSAPLPRDTAGRL